MFIRKTARKNKDGSKVEYYQMVHNERHPVTKRPIPKILYNFGRVDKIDRDALVRLCRSIARLCNVKVIDPIGDLFLDQKKSKEVSDFVENVKFIKTLELGTVTVIEALWERLGIGKVLRKLMDKMGHNISYEKALLAMTANRLCEPESKLGVWDRWLEKVYLPSCKNLKLDHMYDGMDFLYDHSSEVEKSVFFATANLLNLDVDLIFYDTTTASFSIDSEDEDSEEGELGYRKFGKSKDGSWGPQVVVALAVTREGLPVRCWVFPGNTTDAKTISKVRSDLRGWKLNRSLFVADAGINSEENRKELSRACGKYLLATRMCSVSEVKKDVLSRKGRFSIISDNLHAKEVIIGDGERRRRYILCYNPKEAERQRKHRNEIVNKLEVEISKHRDREAISKWAIDLLASKRYKRYLCITRGGQIKIDRKSIRDATRYDGKWVIETNDDTISFDDAACGYKGLMIIEQCFHSMKKTQIRMNPMYHWVSRRIETHIRICVLALLIQRVCELSCGEPWSRIRRKILRLQVTECHTKNFIFFRRNEVKKEVREIFKKLEVPLPRGVLGIETLKKDQK